MKPATMPMKARSVREFDGVAANQRALPRMNTPGLSAPRRHGPRACAGSALARRRGPRRRTRPQARHRSPPAHAPRRKDRADQARTALARRAANAGRHRRAAHQERDSSLAQSHSRLLHAASRKRRVALAFAARDASARHWRRTRSPHSCGSRPRIEGSARQASIEAASASAPAGGGAALASAASQRQGASSKATAARRAPSPRRGMKVRAVIPCFSIGLRSAPWSRRSSGKGRAAPPPFPPRRRSRPPCVPARSPRQRPRR